MDARDLLLQQHMRAHTAAVAGDKASVAERAFGALGDEQMRLRPREDLNLEGAVTAEGLQGAAAQGAFGDRSAQMVTMFTGRSRLGVLSGMAVMHSMQHLGEAFTVRSAGGFGVGA